MTDETKKQWEKMGPHGGHLLSLVQAYEVFRKNIPIAPAEHEREERTLEELYQKWESIQKKFLELIEKRLDQKLKESNQ